MARPKFIDWAAAQKEYITDRQLTYAGISKKYGVSRTVVGQRALAEGWKESRKSIIKKTITSVEGELIENNAHINTTQQIYQHADTGTRFYGIRKI